MISNKQNAVDLLYKVADDGHRKGWSSPDIKTAIIAARDAAWREGVEAALVAVSAEDMFDDTGDSGDAAYSRAIRDCKDVIRALLPPDPVTAPGHTDLMVAPESVDAFMEANPLPDEGAAPDAVGALRKVIEQFANPANWYDEPGNLQWAGKRHALDWAAEIASEWNTALAHRDAPDAVEALARLFAHGWQNAHLDFDKAHKLGLLTCVGVGRYIISDMGSAAIALARRGDNK